MFLNMMKQIPRNPDPKTTLPDVTVTSSWKNSLNYPRQKKENPDTGEISYIFNPGNNYKLQRTVTPYMSEEDIKKYTKTPSSVNEIDFINNMDLIRQKGFDLNDFNAIDSKMKSPFNVPRFLFDPNVNSERIEASGLIPKGTEQSKEEYRNNMLTDVYKYFLLKNKGNRELSWNDAQEFTKKEIDPLFEGSFYNNYFDPNRKKYVNAGKDLLTSVVGDDYLQNIENTKLEKEFFPNLMSELDRKEQMPESEIKNYAIDWLTKYKKMSPADAELYYKTMEDNSKKYYQENYPKFEELARSQKESKKKPVSSNLIKVMKKNK